MLVRMDSDLIPSTYMLLRIEIPDDLAVAQVELSELPPDWRDQPAATRQIGDRWLDESAVAMLRVPSAIAHSAQNLLLNPAHPAAANARIAEMIKAPFDPRLIMPKADR